MLKILLDAGFTLNCKANGGSPALDVVLKASSPGLTGLRLVNAREGEQGRFRDEARRLISAVEDLVEQGARWVPDTDDRGEMRWVRDALLAIGETHALTLFDILEKSGAASSEHIDFLLRTPRMKSLAHAARDRS